MLKLLSWIYRLFLCHTVRRPDVSTRCVFLFLVSCRRGLTCLGVSSLVGDPVDGVQQPLLVAVRVQLELRPGVVAELGDGHLSGHTGTQLTMNE